MKQLITAFPSLNLTQGNIMNTTTNYHNANDVTTVYTNSKTDMEQQELIQDLMRNIFKVVNKLVPIKMRFKVRRELIYGPGAVELTEDEKKYVVMCKVWLRAYYAGKVSVEIVQPWHKRSRKLRRV